MKIASIYILVLWLLLNGQKTKAMEEEYTSFSNMHKSSEKPSNKELTDKSTQTHKLAVIDKLTKEHCQQLKGICSQFVTGKIGPIPMNPRSGWIKKEELDDLNILCLDRKKWKNDAWLSDHMRKALERLYHLTENLLFLSGMNLVRSKTEQLSKDIEKTQDPIKAFSLITGFQETSPSTMQEIFSYVPTIQKMTHTLVQYYSEIKNLKLDSLYGAIPIGNDKILAYVKGYLPLALFPEKTSEDYEVFRLPYLGFCEKKQSVCLVNGKGEIVIDTGLVIKHEDVYGISLIKEAFVYCGIDSENPFTMSPFELITMTNFTKEDSLETILKTSLGKDFPLPGKTAFIPLPQKEQEKNLIELIFLENLQKKAKKSDPDALRMIAYIEEEADQKLEQIIENLTLDQLKIIEEQKKISQAVSEDQIVGRTKKKDKTPHKNKSTKKSLNSNKKTQSFNQQILTKSLVKEKLPQTELEDIKSKGRVKYRKVLGVINRVMKHALSKSLAEGSKGSHKTLHSEMGVVTSVKPHGKKDLTIPGRGVKRFTERLLNILNLN